MVIILILITAYKSWLLNKNKDSENIYNWDIKSWVYTFIEDKCDIKNDIYFLNKIEDWIIISWSHTTLSAENYDRLPITYAYCPYIFIKLTYDGNILRDISVLNKKNSKDLWNPNNIKRSGVIGNENIIYLSKYEWIKEIEIEPHKMIYNDTDKIIKLTLVYKPWEPQDTEEIPPFWDYTSLCPYKYKVIINDFI